MEPLFIQRSMVGYESSLFISELSKFRGRRGIDEVNSSAKRDGAGRDWRGALEERHDPAHL